MDPNEKLDKASDPAAKDPEPDTPETGEPNADDETTTDGEHGEDEEDEDPGEDDGPIDLERRILCSDGSCIGVIGPDGRCKVCGTEIDPADAPALAKIAAAEIKPDAAKPDAAKPDAARPATAKPDAARPDDTSAPAASASEDEAEDGIDLDHRRLCSDGACIGVVGKDNKCKVCGKPYTGDPD